MFDDSINFNCDECGGTAPPPKFMIPPPPRPPFMKELLKCRDNDDINSSSYISSSSSRKISSKNIFYSNSDINFDNSDICEAIPILDASYHSSPSLQTSAIIAVFSLLLVLVILISSLFVWKHKRKVQNFLPCKTTTRGGPHIGGTVTGGHSVVYEDPDTHLGHRPFMMRHHHNVEMLTKSVHYPSGYPMTRSPPHLVCNSPGPDPYRSNDNVYEELNPARVSDNESERAQSDDEFAEDELSLPSERNLNKLSQENKSISCQVSTIYHEQCSSNQQFNGNERNSLLQSSSDYNRINNKQFNASRTFENSSNNSISTINRFGILSGVFRNTTGRNNKNILINNVIQQNNQNKCQNHKTLPHNSDALNRLTQFEHNSQPQNASNLQSDVTIPSTQLLYDDDTSRNNLMQLAYSNINKFPVTINSSNIINTSRIGNFHGQHCYNSLDNDVERRNRINQLHHNPGSLPPVSTIFRGNGTEKISNNSSRYPQLYYTSQSNSILSNQKSRTNPKTLDRRRIINAGNTNEPAYGYAEPVFHEGLFYNTKSNYNTSNNTSILHPVYSSYVLPDFSASITETNSGSFRTLGNLHSNYPNQNSQQQYFYHPLHPKDLNQHQQNVYSRDSSFTSDSGYSHQTSSSTCNTRSPNRNTRSPNSSENRNICIGSSDIKTPTSSTTSTNLSLPLSDSGCTINDPSSLNGINISVHSNCDKQNNNLTNTNSIPFGWARTRTANSNSNHKKCKDNNSRTTFSLGYISTTNNKPNLLQTTERIAANNFNIESETERNIQSDNQENSNINSRTNNCLSSSPNNIITNVTNTNNNIIFNNNNNNSITNISNNLNDQTNRSVINSDSNNSFNNNNTNTNNSCKSQS